ncbi:MAG: OstA family protein [Firmicutes bacterium]|nr:OstA family protein [Bacillota bacterium]
MRCKVVTLILAIVFSFTTVSVIYAATANPVDLSADTIEYDSAQGVLNAQGSVKLTRGGAVLTGSNAQYNTKSKEAVITGGVRVVREDATLIAAEVRSYNDNYLVATGGARINKGENTLTGNKIEYWVNKAYSLVTSEAVLTMPDGVMTADKVEAFHNEDRAVGSGNVHIVSNKRNLDATADEAVYYGAKKAGQDKVVLSGNAHAVQDGNTLTGNTLTVYLDNKTIDAKGRTRLVITPQ